ncbi:uncharacterized protein LOC111086323 [Limulus polyphemus]|uniref:Uncharacterized protein LOC111086323 n=1 Tax=Limulus polyphemus TaxID=6850 RepID=A0ABM1SLG1_LIMPO|nr:uncharacterized protein LOC111086323 [Limulus polyphemus]
MTNKYPGKLEVIHNDKVHFDGTCNRIVQKVLDRILTLLQWKEWLTGGIPKYEDHEKCDCFSTTLGLELECKLNIEDDPTSPVLRGEEMIHHLIRKWNVSSKWMYFIRFLRKSEEDLSTKFHYSVQWSLPTPENPIPMTTAAVYVTQV